MSLKARLTLSFVSIIIIMLITSAMIIKNIKHINDEITSIDNTPKQGVCASIVAMVQALKTHIIRPTFWPLTWLSKQRGQAMRGADLR